MQEVLQDFGGNRGNLPCRYLGLPLGIRKPRRVEIQPLLDCAAAKLKGWKGKLMNRKGRLALINSVVTSTATYYLTAFPADSWFIKNFDKLRRQFLWAPDEEAHGGKCIVNWKKISAPMKVGGLGIKSVHAFSRALRLRWEWLRWSQEDKPWLGTPTPCDESDKQLFAACTEITIGNGKKAKFWHDRWLNGQSPMMIAPDIFPLARRKTATVHYGLTADKWMRGLNRITNEQQLEQFLNLWTLLQEVVLTDDNDKIKWKLTADGNYSASSAYDIQFLGRIPQPDLQKVWSLRIEGKVKFYLWLLLQNQNWTADRLLARGWPHDDRCSLCDQTIETAKHLAPQCPFAKEVWFVSVSGLSPQDGSGCKLIVDCQSMVVKDLSKT